MNQKHAREARIINRVAGTLVKKEERPVDDRGVVWGSARHKLPRAVKRMFERKNHREKGRVTRFWRGGVAHSLKARGITPKGDAKPRKKAPQTPSRSVRNNDRRILNKFVNDLRAGVMPAE